MSTRNVRERRATWKVENFVREREITHGTYVNGKKHREWKRWYESGVLMEQITYVNDKKERTRKYWSGNGTLVAQETLLMVKRHGEYKWGERKWGIKAPAKYG